MRQALVIVSISVVLHSCMADLRTPFIKNNTVRIENVTKGEVILENAWKAQGFNKLANHIVYSLHGSDTWKGMIGKMGKPWPDNKSELEFKFEIGTFNSQISFLDGKRKGESSGLQNFKKIDGIFIPHEQTIYINGIKSNQRKHIHQMIISDFQFDTFNVIELYPNKELKNKGKYD